MTIVSTAARQGNIFTPVCHSVRGGACVEGEGCWGCVVGEAWWGHVWHGRGCALRGACMAGGHAWQGVMHGGGACMTGGMYCKGVCMAHMPPHILRDTVNERTVRILLECILVSLFDPSVKTFPLITDYTEKLKWFYKLLSIRVTPYLHLGPTRNYWHMVPLYAPQAGGKLCVILF